MSATPRSFPPASRLSGILRRWARPSSGSSKLPTRSVSESCELMLGHLAFQGRFSWRRMDEQADHPADSSTLPRLQGSRTLTLEWADLPPSENVRDPLRWLGRLADTRLRQLAETSRLYERSPRLALAERLQRALYAIADQASTDRDMPDVLRALHEIVGSLMYAENFYIVLYDAVTDSMRFAYFVDIADTDPPSPDQPCRWQDMAAQPDLAPAAARPRR